MVRLALPTDADIIAAFQIEMAMETENMQLDAATVQQGVKNVFLNSHYGRYYVYQNGEEIAASLLITYEWSDWRNRMVAWIQSVYVKPEYRKNGIFAAMYMHLKEMVQNSNEFGGLRLYVDKTNTRAQRVYEKMGMNGEHYQLYEWMK